MTATPITPWRRWRWLAALLVPPAFFADNIYGRLRFEWLCQHDAGWRVEHKLQRGGGLYVSEPAIAEDMARLPGIGFVRTNKAEQVIDIKFLGTLPARGPYASSEADHDTKPRYRLEWSHGRIPEEVRTSRTQYKISEAETGSLVATWTNYSFSLFNQDRTPLGAPSGISCPNLEGPLAASTQQALY